MTNAKKFEADRAVAKMRAYRKARSVADRYERKMHAQIEALKNHLALCREEEWRLSREADAAEANYERSYGVHEWQKLVNKVRSGL